MDIRTQIKKNKMLYPVGRTVMHRVRFLFHPYKGVVRNYFFFPLGAMARMSRLSLFYNKYKSLDSIKNRYQGQSCFIIATGPSLRMDDLEKLSEKNVYCFGVNSIFRAYDRTSWRPDGYVIGDVSLFGNYLQDGDFAPRFEKLTKKDIFLVDLIEKYYGSIRNAILIPINFLDHNFNYESGKLYFSDNLLWGAYDAYTVTALAMCIAAFMGFRRIYLLGVDCNYQGPQPYCIGNENTIEDFKMRNRSVESLERGQNAMLRAYHFYRQELKKRGIEVINCTRGGNLEIFERQNFDEVINRLS